MNKKTITLTAVKYEKADKAGDVAAYYILSDARFIADLLTKIKEGEE